MLSVLLNKGKYIPSFLRYTSTTITMHRKRPTRKSVHETLALSRPQRCTNMTSRFLSLSVLNNLCRRVCRKRVRNTSTNGERSYNLRPEDDVEGINPEFGKWYYTPSFNETKCFLLDLYLSVNSHTVSCRGLPIFCNLNSPHRCRCCRHKHYFNKKRKMMTSSLESFKIFRAAESQQGYRADDLSEPLVIVNYFSILKFPYLKIQALLTLLRVRAVR